MFCFKNLLKMKRELTVRWTSIRYNDTSIRTTTFKVEKSIDMEKQQLAVDFSLQILVSVWLNLQNCHFW